VAEKGICALSFVDKTTKNATFEQFSQKWKAATISVNLQITASFIQKIFNPTNKEKLNVWIHGTNFQLKVWEALLKIPQGSVATYQKIAESIQNPKAVRAVGTAIGSNPIAFLIPCHRVIKSTGLVGEYHWGSTRKQAILGWEMAK
jgi:AraC family transcriptional regulator, regulatory protein of adaptative response / methylated-DNA-[protein]-cysteine methyltransferase